MSQNTARFTLEELIVKKLWVEGKRIESLDLGALVVSDPSYNVGIGTDTPTVRLDISGTSGLRLPVGTKSERPNTSDLSGVIRYNSTTNSYEGYNMGGWTSLGGTTSIDQETKIEADNNDGLKFITDNVERMRIKENGVIDISTNVNVSGTIAVENLDVSNNVQIYGYTNLKGGHLVIDDKYISSISDAMSKLEFKIRNSTPSSTNIAQIIGVNDGTSAGNGKLKFQVAHNGNYQDALIIDKDKNVQIYGDTNLKGGYLIIDDEYTGTSNIGNAKPKLEFKIRDGTSSSTNIAQIFGENIGTTTPTGKLTFQVASGSNGYIDALIINNLGQIEQNNTIINNTSNNLYSLRFNNTNTTLYLNDIIHNISFQQNSTNTSSSTGAPCQIITKSVTTDYGNNGASYNQNSLDLIFRNTSSANATPQDVLVVSHMERVGIGTNSPDEKLVVKDTGDTYIKVVTGDESKSAGIQFIHNNISTDYGGDNYIDWKIYTGNNSSYSNGQPQNESLFFSSNVYDPAMVISYNGNVGIGTSNPILNLDVSGTRMGRCIRTGSVHSEAHRNSFKIGRFDGTNAENFCGLELKVDTATNMGFGSDNQSAIIFKTWGNSQGEEKECMRIRSDGNVGIGTTSPFNKTQIKGDNGLTISATATTGSRTAVLRLGSPYQDNHDAYCAKITSTNNQSQNYNSDLRFYTSSGNNQSANECMRIETNTLTLTNNTTVYSGGTSHVGTTINEIIFRGDRNPKYNTVSINDVGRLSFEYEHGTYDTLSGSAAFVIKTRTGWKNTGTLTERFRIAGNGYIAIGNNGNNPYTLFDITDIKSITDSAATFRLYTGNFGGSGYKFTNTVVSIIERSVADSSTSYSHLYGMVLGIGAHPTIGFKTKTGLGGTPTAVIELANSYTNTNDFSTATKAVVINSGGNSYFNGGNVGIGTSTPTNELHVHGSIYATTSVTSSDDRLKHNETNIINALETIKQLQPKKYIKTNELYDANHNFTLDSSGNPLDESGNMVEHIIETGLIAQEVKQIAELSSFITGEETDICGNSTALGINYNSIFCYAIQAVKELEAKNQQLETTLQQVLQRLDALENN